MTDHNWKSLTDYVLNILSIYYGFAIIHGYQIVSSPLVALSYYIDKYKLDDVCVFCRPVCIGWS